MAVVDVVAVPPTSELVGWTMIDVGTAAEVSVSVAVGRMVCGAVLVGISTLADKDGLSDPEATPVVEASRSVDAAVLAPVERPKTEALTLDGETVEPPVRRAVTLPEASVEEPVVRADAAVPVLLPAAVVEKPVVAPSELVKGIVETPVVGAVLSPLRDAVGELTSALVVSPVVDPAALVKPIVVDPVVIGLAESVPDGLTDTIAASLVLPSGDGDGLMVACEDTPVPLPEMPSVRGAALVESVAARSVRASRVADGVTEGDCTLPEFVGALPESVGEVLDVGRTSGMRTSPVPLAVVAALLVGEGTMDCTTDGTTDDGSTGAVGADD